MNAVARMAALLAAARPEAVRRLAVLRVSRFAVDARRARPTGPLDVEAARARVVERWDGDLCGFLNALSRAELGALAVELVPDGAFGTSPDLRAALWDAGAALERGGADDLAPALQPRPVVLGGHLVIEAPPRGLYPPAASFPRVLPPPAHPAPPAEEPDNVDELLAAADRALGVRLGPRGRDKGAWGARAQALLGVVERGRTANAADLAPDWRGDVEIKTVAVARDGDRAGARWRVVDDPAIAMLPELHAAPEDDALQTLADAPAAVVAPALAKLQRTLWLARADTADGDATLVSWYFLEWDPDVARCARRYLHARPKGPAGTAARGVYLHKRFFADTGFLASLNGGARA